MKRSRIAAKAAIRGKNRVDRRKPKLLLVCSSGGHLLQLHSLKQPLWQDYDRAWVCFDKSDSRSLLAGERAWWGYFPTNRNIHNLLRNTWLAVKVLRAERPTCVISTGAGIAVPFLVLSRLFGARSIYIESFARKTGLSLTGRLVYRLVNDFFVQTEVLERQYPRARYRGTVY